MKKVKAYFIILLLLFITIPFFCGLKVSAVNTGFTTQELTEKESEQFLSNFGITMLLKEPEKDFIECFAVNENGILALGFKDDAVKTIGVYNESEFLYGYYFTSNGNFQLEWDGDNLNIYLVRGGRIVSMDPAGKIVGIADVPDTIENNEYSRSLDSNVRKINDTEYILSRGIRDLDFYSKLIIKEADGKETVIYKSDRSYLEVAILPIIGVLCIIAFAITYTVISVRRFNKKKAQSTKCTDDGYDDARDLAFRFKTSFNRYKNK